MLYILVNLSIAIATAHEHCSELQITPESEEIIISTNIFYKIQLNFTYCDFILSLSTVLHGIYHHKHHSYEFQTFLCVKFLFKPLMQLL